jgi:membrane protease YdiL (CAAX protease family)
MAGHTFFYNHQKLRTLWRILLFISIFFITLLPLLLINNAIVQFLGATLILLFGLYISSKYVDKRKFSEYGLVLSKQTFKDLFVGFLIGCSSVILMLLIGKTTGTIVISDTIVMINSRMVFLFAIKMFLVSILEETFFRGYLFTNFYDGFKSNKTSKKQAIIISLMVSSVLFGFAHFNTNNASVLSLTMLTIKGIVWCIPFIITKNLGLSIGLHMAWNFTQTSIGFTMSGNKSLNSLYNIENIGSDLLTGGEYGPEAGVLGLIGFIFMLLVSITYLKVTTNKMIL